MVALLTPEFDAHSTPGKTICTTPHLRVVADPGMDHTSADEASPAARAQPAPLARVIALPDLDLLAPVVPSPVVRSPVAPPLARPSALQPPNAELPVAQIAAAIFALFVVLGVAFSFSRPNPPADDWAGVQAAVAGAAEIQHGAAPAAGERTVVIQPGDTLWDLAGRLAPNVDRREVVALLERRNGTTLIQAGQTLILPAGL